MEGGHRLTELSREEENELRFWARKLARKNFGILKACKVVLDENEKLLSEMPAKLKLKENVQWSESFERNFIIWKNANTKFLNLKESTVKNKV